MAQHRGLVMLSFVAAGLLLAASLCLAQPPNDIGAGGTVGVPVTDPGNWQTQCQHKVADTAYTLTFEYGWFNGLTDHPIIGVNGQFPGPLLIFNEGDCVSLTIKNHLHSLDGNNVQYNSTVHFHGQHFHGAVWSDGVPGVTQCLVPYGQPLTYYWQATATGTSWYHGHYDGQYTSGLFGPYIVIPKQKSSFMTNVNAEWLAMLSDGYMNTYKTLINFVMSPLDFTGEEPLPDYLLINGFKDSQVAFDATKGSKVLLRLINTAALTMYRFRVDGVVMQVVEIDGSPVQPYTVSDITIHVAQRISVLLDFATNDMTKYSSVWMRFDNSLMPTERLRHETRAAIVFSGTATQQYYRGRAMTAADTPTYTTSPAMPVVFAGHVVNQPSTSDFNLLDARPLFPVAAPAPTLSINLVLNFAFGADGVFYAYFNGITYNALSHNMQYPSLFKLQDNAAGGSFELPLSFFNPNMSAGTVNPGETSNIYNIPAGAVVDITINNTDTGSHPIHFHGYRFWVIDSDQNNNASSWGSYLLRDVVTAAPLGWTRFRFVANNPGTWLLHCHIDWHFEEGLATMLFVDPLSFISDPQPAPAEHQQLCLWWQNQETAAFNAMVATNQYTPTTNTIISAADAAPWVFITNFIICVESVFALAIYKAGLMYSLLFDLVALNIGTLLGVCWIELERELWLKVAGGALKYEIVATLIVLGGMVPYTFEKFVKRGRANKFAWLKHTQQGKPEPSSVGSDSSGTEQAPSVNKGKKGRPAAMTVTSPGDDRAEDADVNANTARKTSAAPTPRQAAVSVDADDEAGNLIRIHSASVAESPKHQPKKASKSLSRAIAERLAGHGDEQKTGKQEGDAEEAQALTPKTNVPNETNGVTGMQSVELVPASATAIASPSQAAAKAVQIPEEGEQKGPADIREGDGVTLDPTKHGEYKLAQAVAQEMDVVLIIVMLAGDMLHNFVDGSIVASAYLTSNAIGLATSLGIFMEELPHLIGTFAVFVHAGAPIWKAVALSTFGAFPFLLGGALIIGVASDTSVDRTQISYLLAFAVGSFLYITLADLVPVLTSQWNGVKRAIIQTLCVCVGIGMQAGIASYNVHQGEDAHAFTAAGGGTFDPT